MCSLIFFKELSFITLIDLLISLSFSQRKEPKSPTYSAHIFYTFDQFTNTKKTKPKQ